MRSRSNLSSRSLVAPLTALLLVWIASAGTAHAERVWHYTTADGRAVFTNQWDTIPAESRASVRVVSPKRAPDAKGIYRFMRDHRWVYVLDPKDAPAKFASTLELVDLSKLSASEARAPEIRAAISAEHSALVSSPHCQAARNQATAPAWKQWIDLVPMEARLFAGISGAVLFIAWLVSRGASSFITRVAAIALPGVVLATLIGLAVDKAGAKMKSLRKGLSACQTVPGTNAASASDEGGPIDAQVQAILELNAQIAEREAKIDAALNEANPAP